jgi:hypothetical protein
MATTSSSALELDQLDASRPGLSNEHGSILQITDPDFSQGTLNEHATGEESQAYPEGGYGWIVTGCMSLLLLKLTPGAFLLLFNSLGTTYAWGVFQADLLSKGLADSLVLSLIGAISAFSLGAGCLPVCPFYPGGLYRLG